MKSHVRVVAATLGCLSLVANSTWAWDVPVNAVTNAIDLCADVASPASTVVDFPFYRSVPYEVFIDADSAPVYYDTSLGTFEGIFIGGIMGPSEMDRFWSVRQLHPGQAIARPGGYFNQHAWAFIPDCSNISDNSGEFIVKVRPTGWGQLPSLPGEGIGVVAVRDEVTGDIYVFGGGCNDQNLSDRTWRLQLDGLGWTEIPPSETGPSPRWWGSAIYDPNPGGARRMVIYGGAPGDITSLSDVWALDLESHTWTSLPSGPASRYHRAIYDENPGGNRRMLVYGDADNLGAATWQFDLVTEEWSVFQSGTTVPPLRSIPAVALYTPSGGPRQMIVFGGGHDSVYLNDIWSLDLETGIWRPLPVGSFGPPEPREAPAMVIDSEAGESVVFGGYDGHLQVAFDNLWYYNLEEESWIPVAFPEDGWPLGRFGHAMVYDPDYHATVILGGSRPQVPCDEATVHVYVSDFDWYGATSGVTEGDSPIAPALSARAYPNPTNGIATITFDLAIGSDVDGAIYDASGARVATFDRQSLPAGHHELSWDGRDEHGSAVAAGVYFYQIRAGAFEAVGRLVNVQ